MRGMPAQPDPTPGPDEGGIPLAPGVRISPDRLAFSFASSSGPGGQNVNKRATKAELRVRLGDIPLPPDALARLGALAGRRLTDAGEIVIAADEYRSQARNRDACLDRLRELVLRAQVRPRPRRATKPSRGSVLRRLDEKKRRSERKRSRGGAGED